MRIYGDDDTQCLPKKRHIELQEVNSAHVRHVLILVMGKRLSIS